MQHCRVSDDLSRGHVLHYTVQQVKTLVVIGLGGDELLEHAQETRLEKQMHGEDGNIKQHFMLHCVRIKSQGVIYILLNCAISNARSYLRLSWRWCLHLSLGRPAGVAPEAGCYLCAPTEQAEAGEGTEPCRRKG